MPSSETELVKALTPKLNELSVPDEVGNVEKLIIVNSISGSVVERLAKRLPVFAGRGVPNDDEGVKRLPENWLTENPKASAVSDTPAITSKIPSSSISSTNANDSDPPKSAKSVPQLLASQALVSLGSPSPSTSPPIPSILIPTD